jgi:hypothetical protein
MAKLSKEELKNKINEYDISDDIKIAMLEDIEDSMDVVDTTELDNTKADLEKALADLEEMKTKYKERFLSKEEVEEIAKDEDTSEVEEETEEEKVIDVKDIFTDEKEDED